MEPWLLAQVAMVQSGTGTMPSLEFNYDAPGAYLVTGLAGSARGTRYDLAVLP